MTRERVASSNLFAIGYDSERRILEAEFHARKDGLRAVYAYEDVGPHVWEQLRTAASIGREFRVVRDNYIGRLVAHVDAAGVEYPTEVPT